MINVSAGMEVGQPPKLEFQVDPQYNVTSGQGSRQWAQMMWNSMLG
jgi:hypothetical protein